MAGGIVAIPRPLDPVLCTGMRLGADVPTVSVTIPSTV